MRKIILIQFLLIYLAIFSGCNSFKNLSKTADWQPLVGRIGVMKTDASIRWVIDRKPKEIKQALYRIGPVNTNIKNYKDRIKIKKGDKFKIVAVYDYQSFNAGRYFIIARILTGGFKGKLCEMRISFFGHKGILYEKYAYWQK